MFKDLEEKWNDEARRSWRSVIYRAWLGVALSLFTLLIMYLEQKAGLR